MSGRHMVAFYRVSSKSQETNTSLPDQQSRIRYWASALAGDAIIAEIEAVESATCFTAERRKFRQALWWVAQSSCDGMVVCDIDRFFRNTEDGLRVARQHFLECGKTLVFLNQNIDISEDDGWVMFGLWLLMAEKEAKGNKRRFTRGKEAKRGRSEGEPVYLNGHWPYGFKSAGPRGCKKLVVEPSEYPWRQRIFDWKAEGQRDSWICRELNRLEVPTKRGKRWRETTVRMMRVRPLALKTLIEKAVEEYEREHGKRDPGS